MKDKYYVGKSKIVPWSPAPERHAKRKDVAEKWEETMRSFCEERGLALSICNNAHHWIFIRMAPYSMFIVEWWPSSAKLVVQRKYNAGIHTHDAVQAMKVIVDQLQQWAQANGVEL